MIEVLINDERIDVPSGMTVAALLLNLGATARRSVIGEDRAPFCGMGTCHECRVTVDGRPHRRSCLVICEDGMEIRTGG